MVETPSLEELNTFYNHLKMIAVSRNKTFYSKNNKVIKHIQINNNSHKIFLFFIQDNIVDT